MNSTEKNVAAQDNLFRSPKAISKRKKKTHKFKGKLSHANSFISSKITEYFPENECAKTLVNELVNLSTKICVSPSKARNVLQESTAENEIVPNSRSELVVQRINSASVDTACFSPSTALSHLHLTKCLATESKVRRRLPYDENTATSLALPHDENTATNLVLLYDENTATNLALPYNENTATTIISQDATDSSLAELTVPDNNIIDVEKKKKKQTTLTEYYKVRRSLRKPAALLKAEKHKYWEDAIIAGKEEGLDVRLFVGKGRGVVATKVFEKGEFVLEYAGELITQDMAKKREALYSQDENMGCYMYYFEYKNRKYCIDATQESGRLGRLLNHSKNGNLRPQVFEMDGLPRVVLLAKSDIPCGVELTYDYGDRTKLSLSHHPWLAY